VVVPFQKGQSGNSSGRPKQTPEQKGQNALFKSLIKQATVPALQGVIEIAGEIGNKDRLAACRYIIDKAYGANAVFVTNDEPITINIVRHISNDDETDDDGWD